MILHRIGVLSCAKVLGALYTGVGLILGFFFSLFGMLQSMFLGGTDLGEGAAAFGFLFGIGAIVILPIVYGVMGFISGALGAFIYNLVSGVVGGMELVLRDKPGSGGPGLTYTAPTPPAMA
jgi:hypothetical protein